MSPRSGNPLERMGYKHDLREANRSRWALHTSDLVSSYLDRYPGGLQRILAGDGSLEHTAMLHAGNAFELLTTEEHGEMALEMADRTIAIAEEALRSDRYERRYIKYKPIPPGGSPAVGLPEIDETYQPTPKEIRAERAWGRMNLLRWLHYGLWFRTGERPMEIWREMLELHKEKLRLRGALENLLLMDAVEAEDFDFAIDYYRKLHRKNALTGVPTDMRFAANHRNVMYVVSEMAMGNKEYEPCARIGVERWYRRSQEWVTLDANWPWWVRMSWAHLWAKYFTGVTDVREIIRDLRGY